MNSTVWTTLTGFVRHLGRIGKCVVDETPKGWYIAYINNDPETQARQAALAKKERMDLDDEERTRRAIEKKLFELAKIVCALFFVLLFTSLVLPSLSYAHTKACSK